MKRYLIYSIILFVIGFNLVNANDYLELEKPIIEFPTIEHYSLQGFTTTDKYLFMVLNGYDDQKSMIKVYDLETNKLVTSYDYSSLGHANDVTYNSRKNMIYVLAGGGSKLLFGFDGSTFKHSSLIELELPGRSITYIDENDTYAIRTVSTGFILDSELNLNNKIPFIIGMNIRNDVGRQGWSYYNGYIYYSNWSWIRLGGDGSNFIFVYDMNGKEKDVLYTKNDIGEIEDVSFYKDNMILGFNGYDDKIKFYSIPVPEIKEVHLEEVVENLDEEDNEEIPYVTNKINIYAIIGIVTIIFISIVIILKKKKNK